MVPFIQVISSNLLLKVGIVKSELEFIFHLHLITKEDGIEGMLHRFSALNIFNVILVIDEH